MQMDRMIAELRGRDDGRTLYALTPIPSACRERQPWRRDETIRGSGSSRVRVETPAPPVSGCLAAAHLERSLFNGNMRISGDEPDSLCESGFLFFGEAFLRG
jgi:hypothetical protein